MNVHYPDVEAAGSAQELENLAPQLALRLCEGLGFMVLGFSVFDVQGSRV